MHYFLIKSKNGLTLEANLSAAGNFFFKIRYLFIFQVRTSTRRQRIDLFGLRVKLPPVTTYSETIRLSALPKDTSELAGLSSHYLFFMLNVKQGSWEYQLLKYLCLTLPEN